MSVEDIPSDKKEANLYVYVGKTEDLPAMFGADIVNELVEAWIKNITETRNDKD
jgi:hypothetical protein